MLRWLFDDKRLFSGSVISEIPVIGENIKQLLLSGSNMRWVPVGNLILLIFDL